MKQKELEKLYAYYLSKYDRLHTDVVDYTDRYRIRDCDQLDHLESIIAITRLQAFEEFALEVSRLLEIGVFDNKHKK